jgi:hypothetical protein
MKKGTLLLILTIFAFSVFAQKEQSFKTEINGQIVTVMITKAGDTIIVAELDDVSVTSMKKFKSSKERRHYLRMKYHATEVYPYAVEAVRVFRELEATTKDLKKRNRKKQIKRLQDELEDKFKDPLKKLTRTQGRILIKMIERELNTPMYDIVKDLRGGFTAGYWNAFGKMYDINIKAGYNPEDDLILEAILSGMDISHKVAGN